MQRAWLDERLSVGRSIESIARECDRDPSTVSYWVAKHGLRSVHAERHVARGEIDVAVLRELVDRGLTLAAIASELGRSTSTVQHWMRRHGLETARARRRRNPRVDVAGDGIGLQGICEHHGHGDFHRRADGYARCSRCRSEAVVRRRRKVKAILVAEAGGACARCGYAGSLSALHFHHVDPTNKLFHLSLGGITRSLDRARAEAAKCILVCANCHAEIEAGDATILHAASAESPG